MKPADVRCPRCYANPGEPCGRAAPRGSARYMVGLGGRILKHPHRERIDAAKSEERGS